MANRNTFAVLPLFSQSQNSQRPNHSALPKSSWHARLKEHKGVPCDTVVHPRGKILELVSLQERLVCVAEFWIAPVEKRPIRSLVPTRVEHSRYRHDRWSAEAVCNIIGASLLILDVQIKLL